MFSDISPSDQGLCLLVLIVLGYWAITRLISAIENVKVAKYESRTTDTTDTKDV
jgi:hypothetical protein